MGIRAKAICKPTCAAGKCAHHASGRHTADAIVCAVRNEHVAACPHSYTARLVESSARASPLGKTRSASRKRAHHTAGRHLANAVLKIASDKNIVARVRGGAMGVVERGARAGAVNRAHRSTPSNRASIASERNEADTVVFLVRNDEVATRTE